MREHAPELRPGARNRTFLMSQNQTLLKSSDNKKLANLWRVKLSLMHLLCGGNPREQAIQGISEQAKTLRQQLFHFSFSALFFGQYY